MAMTTKNETKHTPGPWVVGGCDAEHPSRVLVSAKDGQVDIYGADHMNETMANARLITAAPEMLAALRALVHRCEDLGIVYEPVFATADAAIAKAEGR